MLLILFWFAFTGRYVKLHWTPGIAFAPATVKCYNLYRSVNGGPNALFEGCLPGLAYKDKTVSNGNTYTYTISTVDTYLNVSPLSPMATVTVKKKPEKE